MHPTHPTIANRIVTDRIATLYRDGATERLATRSRQLPVAHHGPHARSAGLRGWLRLVLRGAA